MSGKMLPPLRNRRRRVPRDGWKGPNRRRASSETLPAASAVTVTTSSGGDFYAHLDKCSQCADNPFALCREGSRLIHAAVADRGLLPKEGK
jgi:hypothetical protein